MKSAGLHVTTACLCHSKLTNEAIREGVAKLFELAEGKEVEIMGKKVQGKKRNFLETIELQVGM